MLKVSYGVSAAKCCVNGGDGEVVRLERTDARTPVVYYRSQKIYRILAQNLSHSVCQVRPYQIVVTG